MAEFRHPGNPSMQKRMSFIGWLTLLPVVLLTTVLQCEAAPSACGTVAAMRQDRAEALTGSCTSSPSPVRWAGWHVESGPAATTQLLAQSQQPPAPEPAPPPAEEKLDLTDQRGERIMNPGPMPVYADTRHLVSSVLAQPGKYSWQVMNWKIAIKELAVSGCDYMTAFRYKKRLGLAASLLFGNKDLVSRLIRDCPDDIVVADHLDALMERMNRKSLYGLKIDRERMEADRKST